MATCIGLRGDELAAVGSDTSDPLLRALEVAIHVEETVDVVLPDVVLDEGHLGTAQATTTTVAALLKER